MVDVIAQNLTQRVVEDVRCGVVVTQRPSTKFVVRRDNLITDIELAVLHVTGVKDVAVVDLDVRDLKLGNTINDDAACVVLLATGLRVEAGAVEEETERGVLRNILRCL